MIAIILAGGRSERFGEPKAFAEIDSQMFYQRIINVLDRTNMFNKIVISTNEKIVDQFNYDPIVIDQSIHKDKGPLAGIYSTMCAFPNEELYFVISVDTPLITQKAISHLYQFMVEHLIDDQLDIAGFKEGQYPIPTIAFYSPRTKEVIKQALTSNDYSLKNVYSNMRSHWLDVDEINSPEYWYKNINYQQDLDSIKQKLEK